MERLREEKKKDLSWGDIGIILGLGVAAGTVAAGICALSKQQNEIKTITQNPNRNRTKEEYIGVEYDISVRDALVYLYTSPPRDLPGAVNVAYHHWAIVIHFDDKAYRTLEGYGDDDGYIYGHYNKVRPADYVHMHELGSMTTSPRHLWEYARDNVLNGTPYNTTMNNCQTWALELVEQLGEHILQKLRELDRIPAAIAVPVAMCSALAANITSSSK